MLTFTIYIYWGIPQKAYEEVTNSTLKVDAEEW